jgi:hypothetical protein
MYTCHIETPYVRYLLIVAYNIGLFNVATSAGSLLLFLKKKKKILLFVHKKIAKKLL